MKRHQLIAACLVSLIAVVPARSGELSCCPPPQESFWRRFSPAGGWFPYGGGLVHWWPRHCFPCNGVPDDYCRKKLPRVCWPPYPPYYRFGPPMAPLPVCVPPQLPAH